MAGPLVPLDHMPAMSGHAREWQRSSVSGDDGEEEEMRLVERFLANPPLAEQQQQEARTKTGQAEGGHGAAAEPPRSTPGPWATRRQGCWTPPTLLEVPDSMWKLQRCSGSAWCRTRWRTRQSHKNSQRNVRPFAHCASRSWTFPTAGRPLESFAALSALT